MGSITNDRRNRRKTRVACRLLSITSLTVLASTHAYAQQAPETEGNIGVGEIVVTAQRREQSLQEVPVSVAVVTGETLEAQNVTSLAELSDRSPGVVIRPAAGGDQISVRGVSSGFNPGFEQSVATFVDGVHRPRGRSTYLAMFDLERVELLKGPQTTFFGANAIAGAINITTRKPKDEFGANTLMYYSPDDNEYKFEAGVDVPAGDVFAVRLAGRLEGMDSPYKNTFLDQRGKFRTGQVRASFIGDLSDTVTLEGRFDYARVRKTGAQGPEILNCPPSDTRLPAAGFCAAGLAQGLIDPAFDRRYTSGFLNRQDVDLYEGDITATFTLGAVDLITTTAYQDQRAYIIADQGWPPQLGPLIDATIPPEFLEKYEQFSQELRLQSNGDGPFSYMVGAYYEWGKTRSGLNLGFFQAPLGAIFAPDFFTPTDLILGGNDSTQRAKTWSGFASLSYEVTPDLTATAGLRYSSVKKNATRIGYIATVDPWPLGTIPRFDGHLTMAPLEGQQILAGILGVSLDQFPVPSRTDDEWMPSANLSYQITPDIMTYVSYAHGFKAGGYNLFLATDTFGPETVDAYEWGIKAAWLDRRLITNFTLFQSDYKNLQESGNIFLPSGGFIPFIGNVAESRSKGAELEMTARVTDSLNLNASISYIESKYRDYPNAPCSPYESALAALPNPPLTCPKPNLAGTTRPFAPKWSGSVSADYSHEIGSNLKAGLGATLYFTSRYFFQSIPERINSQPAYAKVDLRASIGDLDNGWNVSLIGKNILDKDTILFGGHPATAPGSSQFSLDRGRTVALQLRMNFGSSR